MWQDAVKGILELVGASAVLVNVIRIIKDKELKGVSFYYILFSVVANGYAMYFYYILQQWYAFWGVTIYTILVTLWMMLVLGYKGLK